MPFLGAACRGRRRDQVARLEELGDEEPVRQQLPTQLAEEIALAELGVRSREESRVAVGVGRHDRSQ